MLSKNKVTTFLWFDNNAEEAAKFYVSLFPGARITHTSKLTVSLKIGAQAFVLLNGGKHYKLTPAISLYVACESQEEVDAFWEKFISTGGKPTQCGWLEDKFGLSWQIVPNRLIELMNDPDRAKATRVTEAMMKMIKIDIAALERAAAETQPSNTCS